MSKKPTEKKDLIVINFKDTDQMKKAIKIAAAVNGYASSSELIKETLNGNKLIANELRKLLKKVKK